jgi:hypothetical protein
MGSSSATGNPNPCEDSEDPVCLPEPASGFQIQSVGETINPGEDIEYCEVVELPGDASTTYWVNRLEAAMSAGSHHLIVSAAVPGSGTEANMTVGDKVQCVTGTVFGEDIIPVTGSQHPYHDEVFPAGVGRVYHGGQKLIFDYHYFNTTGAPLQARAAVNFHTVDESAVTTIAEDFGMYNLGIYIPPQATKSFTKTCSFDHDVMVYKLTRHTHQWGTDFEVGFAGGEHIWTSPNYDETDYLLPEPVLMEAGSGFTFTCSFHNTEDHALQFGTEATDEMCILFGTWYRVNPEDQVGEQGCFGF